MSGPEYWTAKYAVLHARDEALRAGEQREMRYRFTINAATIASGAAVAVAMWERLSVQAVLVLVAAVVVLRSIGNFAVSMWASACIERIKRENPMPHKGDDRG